MVSKNNTYNIFSYYMHIRLGINGLGRIGKCVMLQLLHDPTIEIVAINSTSLKVDEIEDYLKYDSNHKKEIPEITVIDGNTLHVCHHKITLLSDRNPENLHWKKYNCDYVIDSTGAFLTEEKCKMHNVDYVIMSAPAKDETNTYIYGSNHDLYSGERIISGSSCTTNCLAPCLKIVKDNYDVKNISFTTIHATTASQYTVDVFKKSSRTNRSILNNIIPHSTGASSSITKIFPELIGKIYGTSVRVPVTNCSLLDVTIEVEGEINLKEIEALFKTNEYYKSVYDVNSKNVVSGDFMTTESPCILDVKASMNMGKNKIKLMLWYDNEWSYSTQLLRMLKHMYYYNTKVKTKYDMKNINMKDKNVVARFDFNIAKDDDGNIVDDYRIRQAIPTIEYILSQCPRRLVLVSHYGRPINNESKYSMEFMIPVLEKYLKRKITFIKDTINKSMVDSLSDGVYLLENIRYNLIETLYNKTQDRDNHNIIQSYRSMGDVFIIDAFGCLHREHMSIYDINNNKKEYGYGYLVGNELKNINTLLSNKNEKILGIIGGAKIVDKMPLINKLQKIPNARLYVGGGLAKYYEEYYSNVLVMKHGVGNEKLDDEPKELSLIDVKNNKDYSLFDIHEKSLDILKSEIDKADIIFWNGPLGVIEHEYYKRGSYEIMEYLKNTKNKKIIIGGGETASIFEKDIENIYVSTGGGVLLEYIEKGTNVIGLKAFTK